MQEKIIIAREISWLRFNDRVLQEANDPTVPLKERVRFLGIFSNNRDEYFRTRMAALKKMIQYRSYQGKNPQRILDQIHAIILNQQEAFNRIWKKVLEDLKKEKVFLRDNKQLNAEQKAFVREYFDQEVSSSIIPLFIESMPQMPAFGDENIFLGVVMKKKGEKEKKYTIIQIPTQNHNRFISLPSAPGEQQFILLEDLIRFNLSRIFSHLGYTRFEAHMFKVTKDAEIDIDHDLSTSYIQSIEKGVKNRRKATPMNFLYEKQMNKGLVNFLIHKLNVSPRDSVIAGGHIRNFRDFMDFPALLPNDQVRPRPFKHPILAKSSRVSDALMQQDILLYFPYHSFNSIIEMLCQAAMDPDVKSIKITAYRLAPNSKICNALINAARSGKKVYVFIELRASFHEKANMEWKAKLEEEGVKVFLGMPHLKVHAKMCIIKKQVGHTTKYYGFIGTGNLHEKTALTYMDAFVLTSNRTIMTELNRLFKILENPEKYPWKPNLFKTLLVSPANMRDALSHLIDDEIQAAKAGKPSHIILNLNSLSDEKMIDKLNKAEAAGVHVEMIIRGIFCEETDQKEGMTAISIVDEYLEHGRICYFLHGGKEIIYISSADWQARNLDRRVEVAIPITDNALKEEVKQILKIKLDDNVKARVLDNKLLNHYVTAKGKKKVRSQLALYHYLRNNRYPS